MKPHRIRMTHNLLLNYGLYRKMEIYVILTIKPFVLKYHFYNIKYFSSDHTKLQLKK